MYLKGMGTIVMASIVELLQTFVNSYNSLEEEKDKLWLFNY